MTSGTVSSGAKRTARKNHGSVRGARNSRANSPDYVDEQHHIREGSGFSGWLFVLPAILVALTFVIIPFINTIRLSFTDATFSNPGQFVGLEQYRKMLADDAVHTGLINSSLYVVCVVPCMVILPLILASLVAGNSKVLAFFRASFYLPVVVSTVIVGLVWTNLLDTRGLVNSILSAGWIKQAVPFLTDRWLLLFSAMAITIWTGLGYYMIIYLSALAHRPLPVRGRCPRGAGVATFPARHRARMPFTMVISCCCLPPRRSESSTRSTSSPVALAAWWPRCDDDDADQELRYRLERQVRLCGRHQHAGVPHRRQPDRHLNSSSSERWTVDA